MIHQFFIINKSGGLIYTYERSKKTETNTLLVLASTLHSLSIMFDSMYKSTLSTTQIIRFNTQVITYFKSITGVSFVFVGTQPTKQIINPVYKMYCETVTKDPFYENEMPIKTDLFKPEIYFNDLV